MAWGWLRKAAKYGVRAGTAIATGGGSEAYRAYTGHADPVTAKGEQAVDYVANNAGGGGGPTPPGENPDDRARRVQTENQRDQDIGSARSYSDYLRNQPGPGPRAAPVVGAPGKVTSAVVAAPPVIGPAPTVTAQQVQSTFNGADQAEIGQQERAYLDRLRAEEAGTAGASAAEQQMAIGNRSAVAAQYALASSGSKGYSGAALRAAGRNTSALQQQNIAQTGVLRAQEQAQVRSELGGALQATRAGDLGAATTSADLALRAATSNQGAGLEAQKSNQSAYIDVQKANQGAQLQKAMADAGFSQQAMLHMSDQELQTKLANAGFMLNQEQMDDLRAYQHQQTYLQAQGQLLSASGAAAAGAQEKMLQLQQLQQAYEAARQRGDQATMQMIATGIGYLTGGPGGAAVAKQATAPSGGAPAGPGSYPGGTD